MTVELMKIHDLEAYPLLGMEVFDDHIALKVCA